MDDRYRTNGHGVPPQQPAGGQYLPNQYTQSNLPTLPPLHNSQYPSLYNSHPHSNPQTPITPHTPTTSAPGSASTIPPIGSQHPTLRPIQPSPSSYMGTSYATSQPPLLPTSAAHANVHQLAGTPLPGLHGMQPHALYQPHMVHHEPEPIHVVGQQGRRGVLPTHPGRPAPNPGKAPTAQTKNADGKYECPHCNKTYLHLKHLKRHLLRRRYPLSFTMCVVTDVLQTRVSALINVICARIRSRGAIF